MYLNLIWLAVALVGASGRRLCSYSAPLARHLNSGLSVMTDQSVSQPLKKGSVPLELIMCLDSDRLCMDY